MAYALKDGQGTMFTNDKKGNDKAPDRRGELLIDGVLYEVAGWVKQGQKGPWMSIQAKPKEPKEAKREPTRAPVDPTDDIPF